MNLLLYNDYRNRGVVMSKLSDTTNIGLTFQMSLDSFLDAQHPVKKMDQTAYDKALHKLEELKCCRSYQKKTRIAQEARTICPDCIESYIAEGIYSQDIYDSLHVLKRGMELAVMNLGKDFFLRDISDFDSCDEAKPLLHIKFTYACTLFEAGYMRKAEKQFKELLNLHPSDVFLAHHYLYVIYLYFEELESCRELLNKYHSDSTMDIFVDFLYQVKSENMEKAGLMIPLMKSKNKFLYDLVTYEAMNMTTLHDLVISGSEAEAGYIFRILKKVLQTMEYLHIFIVNIDL